MTDLADALRSLGDAIRERREELGISQLELAHRAGVTQDRIWRWESGRRWPRTDALLRLAEGLEIPAATLLARAELLRADRSRSSQVTRV